MVAVETTSVLSHSLQALVALVGRQLASLGSVVSDIVDKTMCLAVHMHAIALTASMFVASSCNMNIVSHSGPTSTA